MNLGGKNNQDLNKVLASSDLSFSGNMSVRMVPKVCNSDFSVGGKRRECRKPQERKERNRGYWENPQGRMSSLEKAELAVTLQK